MKTGIESVAGMLVVVAVLAILGMIWLPQFFWQLLVTAFICLLVALFMKAWAQGKREGRW